MKKFITILISLNLLALTANADVLKDFDGLGENKDLYDTAKALHPEMNVSVVQERIIKRRNRVELAPEIGMIGGGEKYLNTSSIGLSGRFHINPWVSVGGRYTKYSNELTGEAENLINTLSLIPDVDSPKSSYMGMVDFYPIYGKMNTFGMGITHFDLYLSAGYGQIALNRGDSGTWSAGGGISFWWSQHFTTRLEVMHQNYDAKRLDGTKNSLDLTVASIQIGYLI